MIVIFSLEKKPVIIAHAGCLETSMDSLESIEVGHKSGAIGFEVDVNITKDNVIILSHDEFITDKEGNEVCICNLKYKELKKIKKVYTLEDAIRLVASYNGYLNVDVKNVNVICKVCKLLEKYDYNDRTYFTGIRMKHIEKVFAKLTKINIFTNLEGNKSDFICETLICSKLGAIGVNLQYQDVDDKIIDYVRNLDIFSSCWTVDDEEDMKKMIACGVDLITTNRPDLLSDLIK